jgi:hypothetical protein
MSIQSTEIPPNLKNIYKVNNIVDNKIQDIYVFYGSPINKTNKELINSIRQIIFTKEENENIDSNNINLIFSEEQIHFDDSIGTIKIKLLNELKNSISIEEIYLFCKKIEKLNSISVYESLTQNKKLDITKQKFISL